MYASFINVGVGESFLRFFIAGIMQGSRQDPGIHRQDYRTAIKEIILQKYPQADIICPFDLHPDSPYYGPVEGKKTFLDMLDRAREVDYLIAYLPEASMGTAIEMWEAYEEGVPILSISPLTKNWVVKFFSARIFATLEEFGRFIANDGLEKITPGN